jgi:hypothetical protein
MDPVKYKYGLDETPPFGELVFLGLQWLAIFVPNCCTRGENSVQFTF